MDTSTTKSLDDINSFIREEKNSADCSDFTRRIGAAIQHRANAQSRLNSVNYTTINSEQCVNLALNGDKDTVEGLIEVILYLLTCAHAPDKYSDCVLCASALAILQHKFHIVDEVFSYSEMRRLAANNNGKEGSAEKHEKSKREERSSTIKSRKKETSRTRRTKERYTSPPRYKPHDFSRKYAVYYKSTDSLREKLHTFFQSDYRDSFLIFNNDKVDKYNAGHYFRHALHDYEVLCDQYHRHYQHYQSRRSFMYRTAEMERLIWHPIFKTQLNNFLKDHKESPLRVIKNKVLNKTFNN